MSRLLLFLNILLVLIATTTSLTEHNPKPKPRPNQKPHTFVLPVFKTTNEDGVYYYTNVSVGKPPLVLSLNIDISSKALWFACGPTGYNSATYTPVPCGSKKCKQAKGECSTCSGSDDPACRKDTCNTHLFDGLPAALFEDYVTLSYTSPSAHVAPKVAPRMPLACIGTVNYHPVGTQGIIGLSNGPISFVNRLVSTYKIPYKVALCLPSKLGVNNPGVAYIGGGPYVLQPNGKDVSGLFVSTALIRNIREDQDDVYYIDVKSIEVNGRRIPFNRDQLTFNKSSNAGGTMIRNSRHTYFESSIYKALIKAFAQNAMKVKAVYPFIDCFSSTSFGGKKTPVISLVLGGGAKWNIYGPNLLVKVNKSVVCLSFFNLGESPPAAIMIGNDLMEDNLVEFDLEASKFSITSLLLRHNTSCSHHL